MSVRPFPCILLPGSLLCPSKRINLCEREIILDGDDGAAWQVRRRDQVQDAGRWRREKGSSREEGGGSSGIRQDGQDGEHEGGDQEPARAEAHRQEPRRRRLYRPHKQEQALLPRLLTQKQAVHLLQKKKTRCPVLTCEL